jgi:ABC-type transporter lipoprotein component MlaA
MRTAALALLSLALAGCATTAERDPADPFQSVNRSIYSFNSSIDRAALKPVAVAYRDHTPTWFRTGVGNFYENLSTTTCCKASRWRPHRIRCGSSSIRRSVGVA